jgi:hypothetical protein
LRDTAGRVTIENMENPFNLPSELWRQVEALLAVLIANPELLEVVEVEGLRTTAWNAAFADGAARARQSGEARRGEGCELDY